MTTITKSDVLLQVELFQMHMTMPLSELRHQAGNFLQCLSIFIVFTTSLPIEVS